MGVGHLIYDIQFTICWLTPVILSFYDVDTTFRVTSVELHILTYFLVETLQPDIVREWSTRNWFESASTLELYEPRVHQELASLVNSPDAHGFISGWGDQELHFLNVDHIQDTAIVSDNSLEALVLLCVFWLPQFDCSIGTCWYQNTQTIDLSINQFSDRSLHLVMVVY